MRHRRLQSVFVLMGAAALAVATIAPTSAQDASAPGVGSSEGSASVLSLLLGSDALGLRLVGEDSATSNDPAAGGPLALERVVPLQLSSTLVPGLSGASQPTVETSSTSGEKTAATPGVDLGSLVAGLPVPGLLSGTIDPVALRSLVDADGALSAASGAVRDLSVLGGLLSLDTATVDLGSSALLADADAVRGLELDRLEVLDLTALLDALGISLADLPLDAAVGLLDGLGLPLPADLSPEALLATVGGLLDETGAVRTQVSSVQGQIDDLQAQLAPLTAELSQAQGLVTTLTSQIDALEAQLLGTVCAIVPALCSSLQAQIATATAQLNDALADVADIGALIDTLQAQIDALLDQVDALLDTIIDAVTELLGLLDGVLDGLDGASLLVVEDLAVGLTALADETLATSVAEVVGSVGDVRIGGLSLGGLDAGALLGDVSALSEQVTGTLGGLLSIVDPSLGELVDIDLLDQTTSVTEANGVTEALAGITGLRVTITPPDVCSLLGRLGAQDTLGSLLGSLGESLPSLPGPVGDVLGDLGSTVACGSAAATKDAGAGSKALVDGIASALTQPLTVEALDLTGAAAYGVPTQVTTTTTTSTTTTSTTGPGSTPTGRSGNLPRTGGEAQLAVLALALGAAGFGVRRLLGRAA